MTIFIHIAPNLFCLNFLTQNSWHTLRKDIYRPIARLSHTESRTLGFSKEDKKEWRLFLIVAKCEQYSMLTSIFISSWFPVMIFRENCKAVLFHICWVSRGKFLRVIMHKILKREGKYLSMNMSLLRQWRTQSSALTP